MRIMNWIHIAVAAAVAVDDHLWTSGRHLSCVADSALPDRGGIDARPCLILCKLTSAGQAVRHFFHTKKATGAFGPARLSPAIYLATSAALMASLTASSTGGAGCRQP